MAKRSTRSTFKRDSKARVGKPSKARQYRGGGRA